MQMPKSDAEHLKIYLIQWLLSGNLDFNKRNSAIGTEVLFSVNKRKADLVTINSETHAFEIKGNRDTLKKLKSQLADYHKTFDKVSIVTTPKHLSEAKKKITNYTGLISFEEKTFKVIRKAKLRKRLDKYSLLMFLKKGEIARLLKLSNINNYSTDQVRYLAHQKLNLSEIRQASLMVTRTRYKKLFNLFLKDKGKEMHIDDLISLSGNVKDLF